VNFGWASRAAQAFYIWAYLVWKPLLPFTLAPVYTDLVSFQPADLPFLVSAVFIIGASIYLSMNWRRWPGILALWISHLVLLIPMLGLTDHPHYPNDRYGYIVGVLWAVLIAAALARLPALPAVQKSAVAAVAIAAIMLGTSSFRQSHIWRNSVTLFETVIARLGEDKYRADIYWRLGLYYAKHGEKQKALREFSEATKIFRGFPQAHNDMASILFEQGKVDEAVSNYEQVLRVFPKDASTHKNLATILQKQGKVPEAAEHFAAAVKADPKDIAARMGLAFTLHQSGRSSEAFEQIFAAVKIAPDSSEAQFYAGNACMNLQKISEAVGHFEAALKLKPDYVEAHQNLGSALASLGKLAEALPHFAEAARLKPGYTEAQFACAMALEQLGKSAEAKKKYRDALNAAQKSGRTDLAMQIQAKLAEP
jgi:tetratricopeptide (TPR) repeat protein